MATRVDNRSITPSDPSLRYSEECPRTNSAHQRKYPSQKNWRTITFVNLIRLPIDPVGNISFLRLYAALRVVGLISALTFTVLLPGCATLGRCSSDACAQDARITAAVQARIDERPALQQSIHVTTTQRVVYLHGTASSELELQQAESVAQQTPDVERVVNMIVVEPLELTWH
jgi:hypothetical protein